MEIIRATWVRTWRPPNENAINLHKIRNEPMDCSIGMEVCSLSTELSRPFLYCLADNMISVQISNSFILFFLSVRSVYVTCSSFLRTNAANNTNGLKFVRWSNILHSCVVMSIQQGYSSSYIFCDLNILGTFHRRFEGTSYIHLQGKPKKLLNCCLGLPYCLVDFRPEDRGSKLLRRKTTSGALYYTLASCW
jgi:hypothetical protein